MSRTRHHRSQKHGFTSGREPAWYRRQHMRLWRARCNHLTRLGKYDVLPLSRERYGWYW